MDILEAKQLVIHAGKKLVEAGLIARTWGNVSCRVSDDSFVITPSGRDYESLTPDEIVEVAISDLAWSGDVKPSSEKGIHAAAYKLRPQCGFVIHTHQINASAVCVLSGGIDSLTGRSAEIIGGCVPLASYGLPGTGKLRKGVSAAIAGCESKAILMAHHGAVCIGDDYDDAFAVAAELETVCKKFVLGKAEQAFGAAVDTFEAAAHLVASSVKKPCYEAPGFRGGVRYDSERTGDGFDLIPHGGGERITVTGADRATLTEDYAGKYGNILIAELYDGVYASRPDINYIIHSDSLVLDEVSRMMIKLRPRLDDFAQLVGVNVRTVEAAFPYKKPGDGKKYVRAMKGRNALLLFNGGAICAAGDKSDAEAVEMVLEKEAKAEVAARVAGIKGGYISRFDARLMRIIYKLKYSKQKDAGK